MVKPPGGAPAAVAQVIAAGNAIASLPYIYRGGHASFQANGYDCSGSVSYTLAAAGLVSSPMVSGDFRALGRARAGAVDHDLRGTGWAQGGGEFSGFVVRHPPGA